MGLKRNCVLTIKAAHGLREPNKQNLINDFKSRNWSAMKCGDGVGYAGCAANQLNSQVAKAYPGASIPIPPSDASPFSEGDLKEFNKELEGTGVTFSVADYQDTSSLKPAYEAAKTEAAKRCSPESCCKTVKVLVLCSTKYAEMEIKDLVLSAITASGGSTQSGSLTKWINTEMERIKREKPDSIICGKKVTLDCKSMKWNK